MTIPCAPKAIGLPQYQDSPLNQNPVLGQYGITGVQI